MSKKTTLYEVHKKLGAKIVDFAGFLMPLKYSGELSEHKCVRTKVGIFDVSHMGEIEILGEGAKDFCQKVTCNNVEKLKEGRIQYSVLCNNEGGAVDDVTLYKFSKNHFMFCVNASNIEKDYKFLLENNTFNVEIINKSENFDQIAIQGPKAQKVLQKIVDFDLSSIKYFGFKKEKIFEKETIISRTGYTGEDGFEIYLNPKISEKVFLDLLENGKEEGIKPCGLGARDILRLEASYILYGNDLNEKISPVEAGISWTVKIDKGDFIGKDVIKHHLNSHIRKKLIGFKMIDRAIPRAGLEIFYNNQKVGNVSSGSYSPTLGVGIGMGFIAPNLDLLENDIFIKIRNEQKKAKVVKMPFYKKK